LTAQLKMNIWVELVGVDGVPQRLEISSVERIVEGARLDDFGLSLEEGKDGVYKPG
jgi:hypothetical protein